jgi:hypothetical protein
MLSITSELPLVQLTQVPLVTHSVRAKDGDAEAPATGSPAREVGRPRLAPKGESPAREARTEGQRAGGALARKGEGSEGTGTGGRAHRKVGRTKGPGSPEGHPQGRPEREPRPDRKVTRKGGRKRGSRRFAEETVTGATESGSWPFGAGAPGAPVGQPQGTRRGVEAIVIKEQAPGSTEAQAHWLPGAFPRPGYSPLEPGAACPWNPALPAPGTRRCLPLEPCAACPWNPAPPAAYTPNWNVFSFEHDAGSYLPPVTARQRQETHGSRTSRSDQP